MARGYDYAGPSSGNTRRPKSNDDDDYAIAKKLQDHINDQSDTEDFQETRSVAQDRTKGKGKATESYPARTTASKADRKDCPSQYPKPVSRALKDLQQWAANLFETKCRKCGKIYLMEHLDIDEYFSKWMTSKNTVSVCSVTCPQSSCGAETCLGCGEKPRAGKYSGSANNIELEWCCSAGAVFAVWVVLSKYDEEELKIQSRGVKNKAATTPYKGTTNGFPQRQSKGTGYGRGLPSCGIGGPFSMAFFGGRGRQIASPLNFSQIGEKTDGTTRETLALVTALVPHEGKKAIPALRAMIQLSLLQDKVGMLLRNDSLRNILKRGTLYIAVFAYIKRLGNHPGLDYLICDERYSKKRTFGLERLSLSDNSGNGDGSLAGDSSLILCDPKEGLDSSLVDCMAGIAAQSKIVILGAQGVIKEFGSKSGQDFLKMAKNIREIYRPLLKKSQDYKQRPEEEDRAGSWEWYHKQYRVEFVTDMMRYMRNDLAQAALSLRRSAPDRIRRIAVEVSAVSSLFYLSQQC